MVATVPAIVALVNALKRMGMDPKRGGVPAAILLGVGLNLAQHFWGGQEWFAAAAQGLLLGLAAAGLYDLAPESVAAPRRALENVPGPDYPEEGPRASGAA